MEETGHTTQENTIETSSILTEESHRKSTFAKRFRKGLRILVVLLLLALGGYIYVHYFYVFGSGVKTGTLNYVVKKGYIFKTYEGELIMTGFAIQGSRYDTVNQFIFSVDNDKMAEELMRMGGRDVELRYKEYLGALPWRGYSTFIVDSILSVK